MTTGAAHLDTIHRLRVARLLLLRARQQAQAEREVLHASLDVVQELQLALERERATSERLREELRRYTAALTLRDEPHAPRT